MSAVPIYRLLILPCLPKLHTPLFWKSFAMGNFFLLFLLCGIFFVQAEVPDNIFLDEQHLRETLKEILKFAEENVARRDEAGVLALTVPEIIEEAGYKCEIHDILTEDGYILEAHRIPHSDNCKENEGVKRVVWLQHGLMGDSSNWIITGTEQRGLAYELANECYDVWLGNFRGTTRSKRHTTLDPTNKTGPFWDFSLHEVGYYDVPANIDYALKITGQESLYYVGHSMGTTTFFIAMAERPEYNKKVKLMSALAPATLMENTRSLLVRLALPLLPYFTNTSILPYTEILNIESIAWLTKLLCNADTPTQALCSTILGFIGGFNPSQLDLVNLPNFLEHSPAGSSSKVFFHYGQNIVSGDFKQYDYGEEENIKIYGQMTPPFYDFFKITASTAMYYGENDFLADRIDVLRSIQKFPNATIVKSHQVEDQNFNHLDFIWALDQHTLINTPVLQFMEEFTNPKNSTDEDISSSSSLLFSSIFLLLSLIVLSFTL